MMNELFGEFLGTLILILLGMVLLQVVVLPKTKEQQCRLDCDFYGLGNCGLQLRSLYLASSVQLI